MSLMVLLHIFKLLKPVKGAWTYNPHLKVLLKAIHERPLSNFFCWIFSHFSETRFTTESNSSCTPYSDLLALHGPSTSNVPRPYIMSIFQKGFGNFQCLRDCTILELSFVVGRFCSASHTPTQRHC